MNTLKKIVAAGLAATSMVSAMGISAMAADGADGTRGGQCGESLDWVLSDNGVLTISGTGKMYDYETVEDIPWFSGADASEISEINVNDGVESVCDLAFYETEAKEINLPDSVTAVGYAAMAHCQNLVAVTLSDNIETLSEGLFNNSYSLKYVHMPSKLKTIEAGAMGGCESLLSIVIPTGVTEIKAGAFAQCMSLQSVVIPESVTVLEESAFSGDSLLSSIVMPPGLKKIESSALSGCPDIEGIIVPDGVTEIGDFAFTWAMGSRTSASDQAVYIPSSVTTIGKHIVDDRAVIYGFKDSAAEKYAKENDVKFTAVTESMYDKNEYSGSLNSQIDEKPENLDEPLFLSNTVTVIRENGELTVYSGDKKVNCEEGEPFIDDKGRTQMPVRAVAEALGANVEWVPETQTVIIDKGELHVTLEIGSTDVIKNEETIKMDTTAQVIDGVTYIPLRYMVGGLDMRIEWVDR